MNFFAGYVGADLSSLVREAAIAAVNRMFNQIQETKITRQFNNKYCSISSFFFVQFTFNVQLQCLN